MITKFQKLGTAMSKDEMKKVQGGYPPCQPPVCSGIECPSCRYHCELVNPLYAICVSNFPTGGA